MLSILVFECRCPCRAQNPGLTEYQVKAAFVYHFAEFVDWPARAFAETNSPIVIGVLGKNVFGNYLAQMINGRTIQGHPLQFKALDSAADAADCQVLFISSSEKSHVPKILADLHGASILTVSETGNFIREGGMIYLFMDDQNRVRFQINNDAAKRAGLTISSKLLSLAINPS